LHAPVHFRPAVVPFARKIIDQAGLGDRVSVQAGDFQQEGLGDGFDVALVFWSAQRRAASWPVRKVYDCLDPGGWIVLRDLVLDPDRAGPPEAAIFALQMLLATEAGGLDTSDDGALWLAEAGFNQVYSVDLPASTATALTVAWKLAR
jgi:hypothetical protein